MSETRIQFFGKILGTLPCLPVASRALHANAPRKTLRRTLPVVAAAFGVACDSAGGLVSCAMHIMCHSKIP